MDANKRIFRFASEDIDRISSLWSQMEYDFDPEIIHKFRVSIRKLLPVLDLYKSSMKKSERKKIEKLYKNLKRFFKQSGKIRDLQIGYELCRSFASFDPSFYDECLKIQDIKYQNLIRFLLDRDKKAFARTLSGIESLLSNEISNGQIDFDSFEVKLDKARSSFISSLESVQKGREFIHESRKKGKMLRYYFETLAIYREDMDSTPIENLKSFQDLLGTYQDLCSFFDLLTWLESDDSKLEIVYLKLKSLEAQILSEAEVIVIG